MSIQMISEISPRLIEGDGSSFVLQGEISSNNHDSNFHFKIVGFYPVWMSPRWLQPIMNDIVTPRNYGRHLQSLRLVGMQRSRLVRAESGMAPGSF